VRYFTAYFVSPYFGDLDGGGGDTGVGAVLGRAALETIGGMMGMG
jgi:hypothetical protein